MPELVKLHRFDDMGCLADESGACYAVNDGSVTWPDWTGIDSCSCGAELPEVCDGDCEECGEPLWHLIAFTCVNCGRYIHYDETWYVCLDGGADYCQDCVTIE